MKKLMIVVAVVCAAFASQAAAFDWKTSTGQQVYAMNTTDKASGTAYLFDAASYTQTAIVEAFVAGTFSALTYLDSATLESTGAIKAKSDKFDWGTAGSTLEAVFAVVADDNIYISTIASAEGPVTGSATLSFTDIKTSSQAAATKWTSGMTASAGWYAAAVPEPTSGLLMLLGMAGLALRRRRA